MSYDDWESAFRELYDDIPGMQTAYEHDTDFDAGYAEALFEAGFTKHASELEAEGLSQDAVNAIRAEFFEYMGLGDYGENFDWQEWREVMGYQ